jgi:hypothetical protein
VQSFANPQTLNRYSYCLNNPLKYTDPSGYYVALVYDDHYSDTVAAWNLYKQQYDDIATLMETSEELFTIGNNANLGEVALGGTGHYSSDDGKPNFNTGTRLSLNYNALQPDTAGTAGVAWVLAHETIHCAIIALEKLNRLASCDDTQYEEIIALQFQYDFGKQMKYSPVSHGSEQIRIAYDISKRAAGGVDLSKFVDVYSKGGREALDARTALEKRMDKIFMWTGGGSNYRSLTPTPGDVYLGVMATLIKIIY